MEVINFREQPKGGSIAAIFDVVLPKMGITFANFKLIRTKTGNLFPVGPSYSEDDGSGKKNYFPYIRFTKEKGNEFNEILMKELEPLIKEIKISQTS